METGTADITISMELDGPCPDESAQGGGHCFTGTLGCADHDYAHLWGLYCVFCYRQEFYSDLALMCARGTLQKEDCE